jgi:serine phosphatase RsbU (regulator of sigma subunit)/PAS domain-containing protein
VPKQFPISRTDEASQASSPRSLTPVAAERALRELRSLWLVPSLILSVVVGLLIALGKSPFPLFERPVWLALSLVIFVVVYTVVHRRASLLARTLRAQTLRETERLGEDVQRAEARLEEQLLVATAARDFAERILQNVPVAVLVLDAGDDFLIRSANAPAEAMPDQDRQQDGLTGRRLGDVFPGLDALLAEPLRRAAQGGSITLPDVAYGALSRGVTYWTFSLTPQRDPGTRHVAQVIVLAVETTDRIRLLRERERHAEESDRYARIERHRARELEATLTSLSDGVVLCSASGQIVSVNKAAQSILGPGSVVMGESVEAWASRIGFCYPSGQPVPPGAMPLNRTLRDGQITESAEFLLMGGPAPRVVELTSAPVISSDGETQTVGAVAVLRDVTDLRRSNRQETAAAARVAALVQISRRLNATLVESEIHTIVTEGALALLPEADAAGARALLYSHDDTETLTLLRTMPEEAPKRPRSQQQAAPLVLPFDAKSPLLWPLYVQRQTVISCDCATDPTFAGETAQRLLKGVAVQPPAVRSVFALPLVAGTVVTGHLLLTGLGADMFDDPQLQDALTNLTALATIARANARLYAQTRQRADELDALWTVGQAVVSQTHLHDIADTLTERVQAVFGAELCTLSLWEPVPGGERRLRWQGGRYDDALLPESDGTLRLECGLCDLATQEAATQGEIAIHLAVPNPPFGGCRWRAFSGQSGAHSVVSAPLRQGDDTLGALTVYRAGNGAFTPEQVKLLRTLAALAVTAVRSAQSFAYEHRIAQTLQKAWLPDQAPTVAGLDLAATYTPARTEEAQIGGDYYDFLPLGPSRIAFFIGDISGKGLSAAVYTALAKYTLRAFAAQGMSPQEVVTRANTVMAREIGRELFSTLFYGVWDGTTKTLTYVNAGHEPPQWMAANGEFTGLRGTGPILGAFADAVYEQAQVTLQPGDTLALYTDGLPDCRDEQRVFYGDSGIRATLTATAGQDAATIAAALNQAVLDFIPDRRLPDDIALLIMRVMEA